jgi:hypothetical protein
LIILDPAPAKVRFFWLVKNVCFLKTNNVLIIFMPAWRLQERPSTFQREPPVLKNKNSLSFFSSKVAKGISHRQVPILFRPWS